MTGATHQLVVVTVTSVQVPWNCWIF